MADIGAWGRDGEGWGRDGEGAGTGKDEQCWGGMGMEGVRKDATGWGC